MTVAELRRQLADVAADKQVVVATCDHVHHDLAVVTEGEALELVSRLAQEPCECDPGCPKCGLQGDTAVLEDVSVCACDQLRHPDFPACPKCGSDGSLPRPRAVVCVCGHVLDVDPPVMG